MRLNSTVRYCIGMIITFALFVGVPLTAVKLAPNPVCVREAKVVEITSLQYRDATILLDTGETRIVNQATLKPGDIICAERK